MSKLHLVDYTCGFKTCFKLIHSEKYILYWNTVNTHLSTHTQPKQKLCRTVLTLLYVLCPLIFFFLYIPFSSLTNNWKLHIDGCVQIISSSVFEPCINGKIVYTLLYSFFLLNLTYFWDILLCSILPYGYFFNQSSI